MFATITIESMSGCRFWSGRDGCEPSWPVAPCIQAGGHQSNVGDLRAHGAAILGQGARAARFHPALALHTQLQLISARVPVQTLTEHGLNREGRAGLRILAK